MNMGRWALAATLIGVVGCGGSDDGAEPTGCQKDTDCASGRICESGECMSADTSSTGNNGSTGSTSSGGSGGMASTSASSTESTSATSTTTGSVGTEPVCRTVTVTNAAAGEKINAAFCFGLAFDDTYSCVFYPTDNVTACDGTRTGFYVLWMTDQYGDVYDSSDNSLVGQIVQGATGAFEIDFGGTAVGSCTVVGDVATLCVQDT